MDQRKTYWAIPKMAILLLVLASCEKEVVQTNDPQPIAKEQQDTLRMIKLGKKLENPYSVKNMRKAYANLIKKLEKSQKNYGSQTLKDSSEIITTDYYVKFWVENDEQKQLLLADSLNLSEIPLDVEIKQEGDYYVDENTEILEAQWLYASVLKDYKVPDGISYEKVEDLFLVEPSNVDTDEDGQDDSKTTTIAGKTGISKEFLFDLEDEALRLTGNYEESASSYQEKSKKTPQGYVKVYNTVTKKMDPVVGVKVKTRRWFKWAKGWTNSNGYYKVNRGYRRDVHYTVVFKNTIGFKIWPWLASVSSARYRAGKHSRNGYNVNFSTSSVGWRWATVNNATVKYFNYCAQMGIGKPHNNLRIVALGGTGYSSAPMLRRVWGYAGFTTNSKVSTFISKANKIALKANIIWILTKFILPDVIIRSGSSKGTDGVFSTTFHELAHASHFKKVGSGYWMKYINYIITYGAYGNGHGKNAGYCGVGEMWGNYLSAVLSDKEFPASYKNHGSHDYLDENEDWYNPGFLQDVDNIPDVTILEIFDCLKSTTDTFPDLIKELKLKTIYDEKVDVAFSKYSDWP
ncbi:MULTISPECIES: hypothetical protein [Flavobacteriaceae]|uniref:hypothetical protein n=1 Tax=Flavobacteriaceae TaxID=49546 RepID=UPI00234BAC04|nr:hypothetical protein [Muricauda sp. SP22]MDC6362333.1 hypothetical protein [Muricauda sp. SP22]